MPTAPPTAPEPARPAPAAEGMAVAVVEDDAACREGLALAIGSAPDMRLAWVAATHAQALARLPGAPLDVLLVDLGLPDGSGLDLVTELRSLGWNRLVVLASSDDPYAVRSAFQAGAQAYLLKSASAAIVTDGVKRVLDGGVYADPTVAPLLATGTRVPGTDNTPRELSAREVEVLQLVADGQSNKEIGEALSLSALTVKSHLSRIGRKLGTGDRAQMVALAMRAGVIR